MKKAVSNYAFQNYCLSSRRFLVSLFDAFLLTLLSFVLLLLSMGVILPNIPSYQGKVDAIEENRIAMIKISEEAGVAIYTDNEDGKYSNPDSLTSMYKKYVSKHILRSYEEEPAKWEVTPVIEGVTKADFDNDQLSIFYVNYASNYPDAVNTNGLSNKAYLQQLLKSKDSSYLAFISEEYLGRPVDNEEFLFLKAGFAQNLYLYEIQGEKSDILTNTHNYFYGIYQSIWNKMSDEITNSSRFVSAYELYKDNYVYCAHIASLVTVLTYLVCFLILFVLPSFIFRNRSGTFGYRIFSLATLSEDKTNPAIWQVLVRSLILLISNLPTLLIASFLSGGLSSSLVFPLWNNGPSLLQILIISAVIPVVDMFMVSLSTRHKSLAEWASNTIVVDTRKDMMVVVKEESPKEDYTHSNVDMVVTDLPYIDSSTIPEDKPVKEDE